MQITTTKEALAIPLAIVAGAADAKTIPILGSVLLKATKGRLSMLCSDSTVLARALAEVEVGNDGEIAVDVRRLHDLVKAVPDRQALSMSVEANNTLLIKSGRSRFRLPTHPAADYPRMVPAQAERVAVTITAKRFVELLDQVAPSMASGDMRPYLNGMQVSLQDGFLYMVSTDGQRMTVAREAIPGSESIAGRSVILPRKTALLAKRLIGITGDVKLTLGPSDIQFMLPSGTVLIGNAIDGKYPQWESVIPKSVTSVEIDGRALGDAFNMIDATLVVTDKKLGRRADLAFGPTVLTVSCGEDSRCEVDAPCATGGADKVMAVNLDYLRDAFASIGSACEKVRVGFSEEMKVLTMRPSGADYPVAVVMPLRA